MGVLDISPLIFSCGKATDETLNPSLLYVIHQQLVTGNSGLYTVVVDTKSLSENITGLSVTRAKQRPAKRQSVNDLLFPVKDREPKMTQSFCKLLSASFIHSYTNNLYDISWCTRWRALCDVCLCRDLSSAN